MNQPNYKFIANLGDANPLDHGGFFVFQDTTGVYAPLAELYDNERGLVWPIEMDRMYNHRGVLVPYAIAMKHVRKSGRPAPGASNRPLGSYEIWFNKHLRYTADHQGMPLGELRRNLCSADIMDRALGYRALIIELGPQSFDARMIEVTRQDAAMRYQEAIGKAGWAYCPNCDTWHSYDETKMHVSFVTPCSSCVEQLKEERRARAAQREKQLLSELGYAD